MISWIPWKELWGTSRDSQLHFSNNRSKETNSISLLFYQKYSLYSILIVSLILLWTHFMLLISFFFLLIKFIYLFIYFWLCRVFVSVRGLSLVAASGGHSSSRCAGLSLSRPLLLRSTGSRRAGSVVVAHGPSCSAACGIFPDQGSNPRPLH